MNDPSDMYYSDAPYEPQLSNELTFREKIQYSLLGIIVIGGAAIVGSKIVKKAEAKSEQRKTLEDGSIPTYAKQIKMAFQNDGWPGTDKDALRAAMLDVTGGIQTQFWDGKTNTYSITGNPINRAIKEGNWLHTIGESFGGGKVAYILQVGDPGYDSLVQHGLIVAHSDQSISIQWGLDATTLGATSTALGTGQTNTTAIVSAYGSGTAAQICDALVIGGYDDWYLPSKDELNKIFINQAAIGGLTNASYWSSSEFNASFAWYQVFPSGIQDYWTKGVSASSWLYVRAIRAF